MSDYYANTASVFKTEWNTLAELELKGKSEIKPLIPQENWEEGTSVKEIPILGWTAAMSIRDGLD